ncbi:MAG TPA: hypothetical protein VND87_08155 [Stellaceae bacterium]|nr:hypothetical protein [Stellaceae bacterium]
MILALAIVALAALLGAVLALPFLRGRGARRVPWPVAATHGAIGAAGLVVLLLALRRGLPPSTMGTAGFGPAAALLLAVALLLGLTIAVASLRRRPAATLVAVHASVAIAGLVVLWALVSLG